MKILISNNSKDPIYAQIYQQMKALIVSGELKEGDRLPSIRALAKDLGISVITTRRAYDELEQEGYINTVPAKGSYVAPQNLELLREMKLKSIEDRLFKIVEEARLLDIDYEDLQEILKVVYEEV